MLDEFTDPASLAMFVSRQNAFLSGARTIEGHHLLQALLAGEDAEVHAVLARVGVAPEHLRSLLPPIPRIPIDPTGRDIPFSDEVRSALACAREEVEVSKQSKVGGSHLLIGLLRARGPAADGALRDSGTTLEAVRAALREPE